LLAIQKPEAPLPETTDMLSVNSIYLEPTRQTVSIQKQLFACNSKRQSLQQFKFLRFRLVYYTTWKVSAPFGSANLDFFVLERKNELL